MQFLQETLSRRINHSVLTEYGAVVLVRSFVDEGLDTGYRFINPDSTAKCIMIKDRQTWTIISG